MLTFNTNGMVPQHFAFKDPIMDYVFKHLKPEHFIKLYQCCKYFYAKFRRNIIRNLEIVAYREAQTLDPTKCVVSAWNPVLSTFKDCWITDSFIARESIRIPEFSHCNIKKLELCNPIRWKEYVTLTKSGTVEELKILKRVFISFIHETSASVEQLLGQVPNAKFVEISFADFTETSCPSLLSMKRETKFSRFVLTNIMGMEFLNIEMLTEFVVKNAENYCHVHLTFEPIPGGLIIDEATWFANFLFVPMAADYTKKIKSALEAKKNDDLL
uniref:F-box domain-containing protein n=1 Tax=Panagrolaimus sp. PS1159 TaxID=55785 RepID=A0AC35FBI1_9BILA